MPVVVSAPSAGVVRHLRTVRTQQQAFVVNLAHGLHARPCALLIKTLQRFRSDVVVEAGGVRASGRSILGLMMLAAGHGSTITFTITGDDAPEAMEAVANLFATRFTDAYGPPKETRG